ncbi:MAG: class I poly(R)-hydroxyalkanoic acid synthase [Telmatospirillum sp.]|nr:class I poly(R)-hydroxyalkanoic acid synthase [Telmatospirillum sp.]
MMELMERSQGILRQQFDWLAKDDGFRLMDPAVIGQAFQDMTQRAWDNPARLIREQFAYWNDITRLWQQTALRILGDGGGPPVAEPAPDDKRFKDKEWVENLVFDVVKQAYLLTARHIQSTVSQIEGVDPHTARKVGFYTRQVLGALSPSNFAATNPEVVRATIESGGENLVKGLRHLLDDMERGGGGHLSVSLTDRSAFRVGENIAQTPGKVVFQNEMMQLLQYTPLTDTVRERPLLIVPPWINKFYVLDLKPQNSFVRWAVEQGHTVFVISWVNPDETLADVSFEQYMKRGLLAAIDAVTAATGQKRVNAVGYCIGGTLLATTLAWMAAKKDRRVASATYFTSLVDFSDPGELAVFIDDQQLDLMDEHMRRKGYLEAHHLSDAFSLLRENDLIWSFVVRNYLLGQEPMPFDLLYWNSDSTHMPAAMHSFYLRNMYLRNLLREPGGITIGGVPLDLRDIKVPTYFLSAREDHIAPWKTTYLGAGLMGGPVRFVLSGSGHIAGVINPPKARKYGYWTNPVLAPTADGWLEAAQQNEGSWWPDWDAWVSEFGGSRVPARHPGDGRLPVIEDAPGSYVKVRRT